MMPAAKHGDPQLGVDIHLCTVPPGIPVPLPTPHISMVFDPFDYVPILGATVSVCGMKRATAGTCATTIHIPPGFPFAPKLPDKDDELFMGSSTVVADGDPFSFVAVPVLGCQVAGMPSPPRPRKRGPPKAMLLPTTVNVAIPANVVIGGPPTISLTGMAFKAGFSALGKIARSGAFKRLRQRLFKKLNPGVLKCTVLRAEPVNILSGDVAVEQEDFSLPGRLPLQWVRNYSSGNSRQGECGTGWETLADTRLEVDADTSSVSLIHPTLGPLFFDRLPRAEGESAAELELMDGTLLSDHGDEFQVRSKEDRVYHFAKKQGSVNAEKVTEYALTRLADLSGNAWEFERQGHILTGLRDSAGRRLELVRETSATGETVTDSRITEIALHFPGADRRHVLVRYEYDSHGDLVSVIDALQQPYTFAYEAHRMVRHTDRNGLSFYYAYANPEENDWRVVHAWGDGGLHDYRFEYFDALNERRITDSLGHASTVKLSESGLPITEIDPLGGMTTYEYDDCGRTTAVIDPERQRTEYHYDAHGNLLKLIRPDGESIETAFSPADKATRITDPNGAVWQQEWDMRGQLTRQLSPLEAESCYDYDAHGQLVGFTNPLGGRTVLAYDPVGQLTQLTDALGHTTVFEYNILGNVIRKTDPQSQHSTYLYDRKGRLGGVTLPSGATITCAYDPEDNLTRYVDENGAETRLEYAGIGEIKRRIQPDGHRVEYHYDTEERLIGVTNQRGERYQLIRDPLGRIVEEIDYWGQARRYAYNAAGHLRQSIDPLGQVIHYETDPLGRILKKQLPDLVQSGGGQGDTKNTKPEIYDYDANGNLTACENDAIRIQRRFDPEGRLIEEQQGEDVQVSYHYDLNGNRIARDTEYKSGKRHYSNSVHTRYDALDQAIGIEAAGHEPVAFQRNALGQITREQFSDSLRRDLSDSPDGQLTAQRVIAAEGPLLEQSYRYDPAGNLIERQDSVFGREQFTYDPLGRLTAHLTPEGQLKRFLNDPAGDRLSTRIRQHSESGLEASDEKPAAGERAGHSDWWREGEHDGTYYRFDRAGNLSERKNPQSQTHFRWDANQRLTESSTDGKITHYRYDCLGRRISKETDSILTRFLWDGDTLLGDVLSDENGIEPTRGRLREWVYYPGTFEPLVMLHSHGAVASLQYFYHNDPNGCPTRLLDSQGRVVWAARYSAWGGVAWRLIDQVDNPIRLQGQYEDGETGLYYNRHRYYDADAGQFVSQDPIGLYASVACYLYAPNSLTWIDPLGLACKVVKAKSRGKALQLAKKHAQVPRVSKGGKSIGMEVLNETSRGKNWSKMKASGGKKLGMENPNGKNKWFEHPDGHPDAGSPGAPSHHSDGHIHSTNAKGEEIVFTW